MLLTYVNNKGGEAMPRPCRKRKVCRLPRYALFLVQNPSATKTVSPIKSTNMKQLD